MSPKELTERFEHISGSDQYKKQYEELHAAKAAAEDKVGFLASKKKTITLERKQKKEQKEEAEKHLRMQKELVRRLLLTYVMHNTQYSGAFICMHVGAYWAQGGLLGLTSRQLSFFVTKQEEGEA